MEIIIKAWGKEVIWAKTTDYVGKIITINPYSRMSLQYHRTKEETIYVLSGILSIWEGSDDKSKVKKLKSGEIYHVNPNQIHRFGAEESAVMLVEVSTNHLSDVVRLEDDYGRANHDG